MDDSAAAIKTGPTGTENAGLFNKENGPMVEPDAELYPPGETPASEERTAEISLALRQLNSRNPRTRSQAARRLGELRVEPDALLSALQDPNPYVRSAAADALGYAVAGERTAEVVEQLLTVIDDPNDYVCASAIHALGILRAESAADQLRECLDDPNLFIVQAAVLALARIGDPVLGERLLVFLESDNYLILLSSTRAVGILQYTPAAPQILQNLENLLQERDPHEYKLPKAYIETLARLKAVEAAPLLIEVAAQHVGLRSVAVEALIHLQAEEAAPVLAPMLGDPSERLRRHLIELMVTTNYRSILPVLRSLLRDPSAQIRSASLQAIQQWQDLDSAEQVRWLAFHDPNPFIRPQAVTCLGSLLEKEALSDLRVLARDLNAQVRQAAAACIEGLGEPPVDPLSPVEGGADPALSRGGFDQAGFGSRADGSAERRQPALDERTLLAWLETWQAQLPEKAEPQAALDTLIRYLRSSLH